MKIVGIGLNKTGTSTLGRCFGHWNLSYARYDEEALAWFNEGKIDQVLDRAQGYDAFEDLPWPLVYKEIDQRFENSKFILTTRSSPEVWVGSLLHHVNRPSAGPETRFLYGYTVEEKNREGLMAYYEQHTQEVREYFKGRQDSLLEMCFEDGHGWKELAGFLGLEEPKIPFPHANKRVTGFKALRKRVKNLFS